MKAHGISQSISVLFIQHVERVFCSVAQHTPPSLPSGPHCAQNKYSSTTVALERLETQNTLLEERFKSELKALKQDVTAQTQSAQEALIKEREDMFYKNVGSVALLTTLISGMLFGSGAWSLKTAQDKFEKKMNEESERKINEASALMQAQMEHANTKFAEMRGYINRISGRILDRSTAGIYTRFSNDFRSANQALPLEIYETMLNAFCEFSERSLKEARKNFKTIVLPERLNGDQVEHDKDLYINCLYNCAELYSLRDNPEDKDKIKNIIKEICAVLHESESLKSGNQDATEEQRQQLNFTEEQLEMLHSSWESAQETLRSYETKADNTPQPMPRNTPT